MMKNVEEYLLNLLQISYAVKPNFELQFSNKFQDLLLQKKFNHQDWFQKEALLYDENDKADFLGTCFYMINSLQEYNDSNKDHFNRFKFESSYQSKFNCSDINLVDIYFRKYFSQQNINLPNNTSKIFLTHDIDLLNSGLKQDVKYLFNNGNLVQLFNLLFNYFIGKRYTRNIDKLMQIDSEYDLKATFFWLVQNEYDKLNHIENGDYYFSDTYIQKYVATIEKEPNFQNALHKSSNSTSINEELSVHPLINNVNRYHFLKFNPEIDYKKISNSNLLLDTSLGFAEKIGFRNSFGLPFAPYDFENKRKHNFIEVPLHIMDTTFYTYNNNNETNIKNSIIDFFEKNKQNSIITLLWHNNNLSSIKFNERLTVFKNICAYVYENEMESILANDIITSYS